jgi:flagellar hook-length control protein FliK
MAPPAPAAPHPHAAEFHVGPRLGAPGFDEAFAARVGIAVRSGIETASITLNPPELGPVDMQIDVSDGKASVQFAAEHPLTREAIVEALPRLREMLAAHGLDLAGSSVGAELPRRDTPARPAGSGSAHALHDEPAAEARVAAGAVVTRLVDTFA